MLEHVEERECIEAARREAGVFERDGAKSRPRERPNSIAEGFRSSRSRPPLVARRLDDEPVLQPTSR